MEDTNYLDLIILKKIDASSTVEKFGTMINTSFFETANMLGTLKVKGLIDIQSSIGGQSSIALTGEGREFLEHASRKASEEIDALDRAILSSLAGGVRELSALCDTLNIRPKDLAFRLNKLKVSDYVDYDVRSGKISLALTEKGFILAGGARGQKKAEEGIEGTASESSAPEPASQAKPQPSKSPSSAPVQIRKVSRWAGIFGIRQEPKPEPNPEISEILSAVDSEAQKKPTAPSAGSGQAASGSGQASSSQPSASTPRGPPWAPIYGKPAAASQSTLAQKPPWVKGAPDNSRSPPWAKKTAPTVASASQAKPQQSAAPEEGQRTLAEEIPTEQDIHTARLISKIMHYAQVYTTYFVIIVVFLAIVAYALAMAGYKLGV